MANPDPTVDAAAASSSSPSRTVDVQSLSRRELQYVTKELQLCRANEKNQTLQDKLVDFLTADGSNHAMVRDVLAIMPEEMRFRTPITRASELKTPRTKAKSDSCSSSSMHKVQQKLDFESVQSSTPLRRSTRKASKYASMALTGATTTELVLAKSLEDDWTIARTMVFDSCTATEEAMELPVPESPAVPPPTRQQQQNKNQQQDAPVNADSDQQRVEECAREREPQGQEAPVDQPQQQQQQQQGETKERAEAQSCEHENQQPKIAVHGQVDAPKEPQLAVDTPAPSTSLQEDPEQEPEFDHEDVSDQDLPQVVSASSDSIAKSGHDQAKLLISDHPNPAEECEYSSDHPKPLTSQAAKKTLDSNKDTNRARTPLGQITNVVDHMNQRHMFQKQSNHTDPMTTPKPLLSSSLSSSSSSSSHHGPQCIDEQVIQLVRNHQDLSFVPAPNNNNNHRVICRLTGHEMKADQQVIFAHVNGKKYQRLKAQQSSFDQFSPMFVEHPDPTQRNSMLWCAVTESSVPRDIARVQAHIDGHRYKRALPEWKENWDQDHSTLNDFPSKRMRVKRLARTYSQ